MTDAFRKDATTSLKETAQPDSTKSTLDKATQQVTGGLDNLAAKGQNDGSKGTIQQGVDALTGNSSETSKAGEDAKAQSQGVLANVRETAGNLAQGAANMLNGEK